MTFHEATDEDNQRVENENNESSDELLELKKELANEIVDKILEKDSNLFSVLFKGSVSDYLVDENSIGDTIHDEIMLGGLGQPTGLITPALKRYREMFSQAKTKDDLENLKTTIFNEIGGTEQSSATAQEATTLTESSDTIDNNGVVRRACQVAVDIANDNSYGYEWGSTGNKDGKKGFDCQSFVRHCYIKSGINVPPSGGCGTMKMDFEKVGFEWIPLPKNKEERKKWAVNNAKKGDIFLESKHTELYIGDDKIVGAHSNKDGKSGDSGGEEISVRDIKKSLGFRNPEGVLRYKG